MMQLKNGNGKMHLFLLKPKIHLQQKLNIVKKIGKGHNIIYVTLDRSCDKVNPLLRSVGIMEERLFFIACGKPHSDNISRNCVHCVSPNALIMLSIMMIETAKRIPGKKIVVFDSISNLFAYHDPNTVVKFITFVTKQLRDMKIGAVFFVLDSDMNTSENKRIMLLADEVKE